MQNDEEENQKWKTTNCCFCWTHLHLKQKKISIHTTSTTTTNSKTLCLSDDMRDDVENNFQLFSINFQLVCNAKKTNCNIFFLSLSFLISSSYIRNNNLCLFFYSKLELYTQIYMYFDFGFGGFLLFCFYSTSIYIIFPKLNQLLLKFNNIFF